MGTERIYIWTCHCGHENRERLEPAMDDKGELFWWHSRETRCQGCGEYVELVDEE
jgi:hypothetical protein